MGVLDITDKILALYLEELKRNNAMLRELTLNEIRRTVEDFKIASSDMCTVEFKPEYDQYVRAAVATTGIHCINARRASNGNLVLFATEEGALQEVINKIHEYAKGFCTDIDELKKLAGPNNEIQTTAPGNLQDHQLFFLLPKLTDEGVKYVVNEDKTISFLKNDAKKVKAAIDRASIEMATSQFPNYENIFTAKTKFLNELQNEIIPKLKDGEKVYIASDERLGDKISSFIEITNKELNIITRYQEKGSFSTQNIKSEPVSLQDAEKMALVLASVSKPVILQENEFNNVQLTDIIKRKTETEYKIVPETEKDRLLNNLFRSIGNLKINYRVENPEKVWEEIKEKIEKTDNKDLKFNFERVKDFTRNDYSTFISRLSAANSFLKDQVFFADKDINRGQELMSKDMSL